MQILLHALDCDRFASFSEIDELDRGQPLKVVGEVLLDMRFEFGDVAGVYYAFFGKRFDILLDC